MHTPTVHGLLKQLVHIGQVRYEQRDKHTARRYWATAADHSATMAAAGC